MTLTVVGANSRVEPGWDGQTHPVAGVVDPYGSAVVAVPPDVVAAARDLVDRGSDLTALRSELPRLLGRPDAQVYRAAYRWATDLPAAEVLPPAGCWLPADDPVVPEWLRPFGGRVLVALDGDRYEAGVGLKRHDRFGHEIAVGTAEEARGRGLARRLVAQAARELAGAGVVSTYLHDPANSASARVADAAGLPDQGWTALGLG